MPTDQELIKIVPSSRQLAYQATEFYAFFHFGMNTYTNREWGDGTGVSVPSPHSRLVYVFIPK